MRRLGVALHALSDRLHVQAHRLNGELVRGGVDVELLSEARLTMHRAAAFLARGQLSPSAQVELAAHLRGFHGQRKARCPETCPLWR